MRKGLMGKAGIWATATVVCLAGAVSQLNAQDSLCGMNSDADVRDLYPEMVGFWESKEGPGYMTVEGGLSMPVGDSPPEQIRMWTDEGTLIGSNAAGPAQYDVVFEPAADDPQWEFKSREVGGEAVAPTLSDEELEVLVDCSVEDLPRLVGRAEVAVPSGTMHLTLRLVYLGEIGLYGIGEWQTVVEGRHALIRNPITMIKEP